jgi:hypothetical protein
VRDVQRCRIKPIRKYISEGADFDGETEISIRGIDLRKMLFVEIFPRLEIIDLSTFGLT